MTNPFKKGINGYDYGEKTFYTDRHLGVDYNTNFEDLPAPEKSKIISILNGTKGGLTLVFRPLNQSFLIRWLHLDKVYVKVGHTVEEGQIICKSGNSGLSTGPHTHADHWKDKVTLKFEDTINPHKYYMQNQTKVVKSKFSDTIFICTPVSKWEVLTERASIEGFEIPDPMKDTDSLL